MNSVCLDYEKVDFLANLLIPTLARHPISNSFPERGLALKEKHPELVGWPERKLGEVENYQNALSRPLPSLNSMSLPEFIDFILTPHVAEYVLEQVGTPLAEETMQLFMAKVKA